MPYLGSTLFVTTVVVLVLTSLLGAMLLASAFFGPTVERTARACATRPKTSLLVGLPSTAVAVLFCAALLNGPGAARALGTVLGLAVACALVLGLAGVALHVGASLWSRYDADRPYRRLLRGAIVVELSGALPVLGWLFVFPILAAMGIGALAVGLVSRSPSRAAYGALGPHTEIG